MKLTNINQKWKLSAYFDSKFMKQALIIMIPLIGQSLLIALMNVIDVFMIGSFLSQEVLNGVGAANTILLLAMFGFFATNMAGSIYASQYIGNNNLKKMQEVNNIRIMINVTMSIIFTIFIFTLRNDLIKIIIASESSKTMLNFNSQIAIDNGSLYLTTVIWIYPLLSIITTLYQNMTECNKTYLPFLFTIFPVLTNGILNFIFLFYLKMGVMGVAIPTVIARILEITIVITFLLITKPMFRPMKKFWYVTKDLLLKILKSLLPIFLANILFVLSLTAQTVIYSYYGGADILSATVVVMNIMNIFYAVFNSYSAIVPIFIGKQLGVGKLSQAVANIKKIIGLLFLIAITFTIIIFGLSFFIFDILFTNKISNEAISTARFYLGLQSLAYFFLSFSIIFFSVLRAGGFVKLATALDILCTWIIIVMTPLIVSIIVTKYFPNFDYKYIFIISTIGEIIQFALVTICVIKIKWARKLI